MKGHSIRGPLSTCPTIYMYFVPIDWFKPPILFKRSPSLWIWSQSTSSRLEGDVFESSLPELRPLSHLLNSLTLFLGTGSNYSSVTSYSDLPVLLYNTSRPCTPRCLRTYPRATVVWTWDCLTNVPHPHLPPVDKVKREYRLHSTMGFRGTQVGSEGHQDGVPVCVRSLPWSPVPHHVWSDLFIYTLYVRRN